MPVKVRIIKVYRDSGAYYRVQQEIAPDNWVTVDIEPWKWLAHWNAYKLRRRLRRGTPDDEVIAQWEVKS